MSEESSKIKVLAPYLPFQTFTSFIDKLHSTTIPPIVDGSLLQTMSGSMKGQLMSVLKFLSLIDNQGYVQEKLRDLVKSYKSDTWKDTIGNVICESYNNIIDNVDLDSGTAQQLAEAFRKRGNVEGQVLDKAVRFYLSGLKEAGLTYSPFFQAKKVRKSTIKQKKIKKKNETESNDFFDEDISDNGDSKLAKFRIPIPNKGNAIIALPSNISQDDWDMVKQMLEAYVARLTKGEPK
ncbi:MAG: hypothetical protein A2993_02455 [Gammaproteobacteria bacterium RIFCSPLOWO2_01_FULL_47_190]|nr:MAG: hypothetical protein A2993_02455 [Gammaproteobacteria bacterium RIFCSPLOWO2_01_FULL_47_190]